MAVAVSCRTPEAASQERRIARRARQVLRALGRARAELSVALVDDAEMRTLNRTWRRRDRPTDVLAFALQEGPAGPPSAAGVLGDVVISVDTARRQARDMRRALDERLDDLLIHGVLHLLGYDHEISPAEERRMNARARAVRAALRTADAGPAGAARKGRVRVPRPSDRRRARV